MHVLTDSQQEMVDSIAKQYPEKPLIVIVSSYYSDGSGAWTSCAFADFSAMEKWTDWWFSRCRNPIEGVTRTQNLTVLRSNVYEG